MKLNLDARKISLIGILIAIVAVLSATPLGFIPLGPVNATTSHIPVIIGSLIGGPVVGGMVGLAFGLISWINNFIRPTITSFVFWNPIISVIPRIIMGIVPYYIHKLSKKIPEKYKNWISIILIVIFTFYFIKKFLEFLNNSSYFPLVMATIIYILLMAILILTIRKNNYNLETMLAGAAGSLTNTGLVMGLIYLLYGERFASALNLSTEFVGQAILGIAFINGVPEMFVSIIIVSGIMARIKKR